MSKPSNSLEFGGPEGGQLAYDDAYFVLLPAPLERTVSYGGGTRRGPKTLLEASEQFELFDEDTLQPYWPLGSVFTLPPLNLDGLSGGDAVELIAQATRDIVADGKFPITLGGEHTVTAGPVRALAEQHDGLSVLTIDAHLDLRDEYQEDRWSHACVLRRIHEDHGCSLSYAGIRSIAAAEVPYMKQHGIRPCMATEVGTAGWIDRLVAELGETVYISIDVDGLDPSTMPGTGTPEPGGMSYRQVVELLREVIAQRHVVGVDCVELAPIDGQQVSEFTAAKLVAKVIGALQRRR